MTSDLLTNPRYWLDRAEEIRVLAERSVHAEPKCMLEKKLSLTMSFWRGGRKSDYAEESQTTAISSIVGIIVLSFRGEAMAGIREVRVTTTDGRKATVSVEYDDGRTQFIFADQLSMPSPLDPVAAKIRVANQLKSLSLDLQDIEPAQIIIEWTPTKT
jgi:hypothetical protein